MSDHRPHTDLYYQWKHSYGGRISLRYFPTHPVNIPCGRKPKYTEKTHDFQQSVDGLFSHESVAKIEATISEVKGACSDDCDTETPGGNSRCLIESGWKHVSHM
jgi:hypothetical protein